MLGNFANGLSGGLNQGLTFANALQQGPIDRELKLAQIDQMRMKNTEQPKDMIDAGTLDPKLMGHNIPTESAIPYLVAKMQAAKAGGSGMAMTPGRKAADMAFGKEYQDWAAGGLAQSQKGLDALRTARNTLQTDDSITGPARGAMPDMIRAFTNPEAVNTKEVIRGAVQSSLKATLGAQFTEKEGERIFNFAYNDRLPAKQNIERLDRLMKELKQMQASKQDMSDYFENNGSLTGWKGRPVSSAGIGIEQGGGPNPGEVQDGHRYKGGDPADPNSWEAI